MREWLERRVITVVAGVQMATVAVMVAAGLLARWLPVLLVVVLLMAAMVAVCEVGYRLLARVAVAALEHPDRRGEGGRR